MFGGSAETGFGFSRVVLPLIPATLGPKMTSAFKASRRLTWMLRKNIVVEGVEESR